MDLVDFLNLHEKIFFLIEICGFTLSFFKKTERAGTLAPAIMRCSMATAMNTQSTESCSFLMADCLLMHWRLSQLHPSSFFICFLFTSFLIWRRAHCLPAQARAPENNRQLDALAGSTAITPSGRRELNVPVALAPKAWF
jgi:hypothetical protein